MVDENIHYRLLKLMHGASTAMYDFRLWMCSFPILYGIWHPYKYCVSAVYRMFFPIFALLEVTTAECGREIRGHQKLLHIEKMVAALLLIRHKVSARADGYLNPQSTTAASHREISFQEISPFTNGQTD